MKNTIHLYNNGYSSSHDPNHKEDTYWLDEVQISKRQFDIIMLWTWYQTYYSIHQKMINSYDHHQLDEIVKIVENEGRAT